MRKFKFSLPVSITEEESDFKKYDYYWSVERHVHITISALSLEDAVAKFENNFYKVLEVFND